MTTKKKTKPRGFPEVQPIMGIPFTVEYANTLRGDKGEELWGDSDTYKRLIRLNLRLNDHEDALERTLLHETLHGILGVCGLAEFLEGTDENLEETIVVALEHGLHQLYQRRKEPL